MVDGQQAPTPTADEGDSLLFCLNWFQEEVKEFSQEVHKRRVRANFHHKKNAGLGIPRQPERFGMLEQVV